jgi:serine/threonine protein kinase
MWDGRPDLGVRFNELEPLLVPEAIIGRGGFSKVYRGVWRGRSVAVKLLDVGVDDNKSEQRRVIANEVDVCVRCNECPRMVRLYGACLERFCIISEFVDGAPP